MTIAGEQNYSFLYVLEPKGERSGSFLEIHGGRIGRREKAKWTISETG